MDTKDWQLLLTLYKTKNITKAAETLYLTQPAVSYRLKLIEEEFGVKIVHRKKGGLQFTTEGEYLVNYANNMLNEFHITKDNVLNLSNKIQGNLRLGVSSNFAHYILPNIISSFLQEYPTVQVSIKTGTSSEIMPLLHNDDVHLAIVRGDFNWHEKKYLLYEEKVCLISKEKIELDNLPNLNLIHCKTDPLFQQIIDTWWYENYKKPPFTTIEVDRVETQKEMVRSGLGYAIIVPICLNKNDSFYTVNLSSNNKEILRGNWVFCTNNSLNLAIVKTFVDFVRSLDLDLEYTR